MDLGLRNTRLPTALPDGNYLCTGVSQGQNLTGDQIIRQNQIRSLKQPKSSECKQVRVTGTCTC
jgi:hypothetical protein